MKTLTFHRIALMLNVIAIGLTFFIYLEIHGFDSSIGEVAAYSFLCAAILFFWTKLSSQKNPLIFLFERPSIIIDGSTFERNMVYIILMMPIIFGTLALISIINYADGLKYISWMIMSMAVNVGIHSEAIVRLRSMK